MIITENEAKERAMKHFNQYLNPDKVKGEIVNIYKDYNRAKVQVWRIWIRYQDIDKKYVYRGIELNDYYMGTYGWSCST